MRSFLSLLLVVLTLSDAQAQLFMRAYAPSGATFYPPNYYTGSFAAALVPSGHVLTIGDGSVITTDEEGVPQSCYKLRRTSTLNSDGLLLTKAEADGAHVFYYATLGSDTMAVVKSDGGGSIVWQAGLLGANTGEQLLPTGDGGCMLLYRIGNAGSQRAAMVRYSVSGAVLWHKAYRIAGNNANFIARGLAHTADGGYLLSGSYKAASVTKAFVCRLSANGTVSWAREIGPGNNNYDEALTATELPNGNIRVALSLPQENIYLGMVDLGATGSFVSSWGYQGATFTVGSIRFTSDGSAYCTGGNGAQVFKLAPDGTTVFSMNQEGPPGTNMICQALLPRPDGTQVMLGNYTTNPFSNFIPVLYGSGPLGVLPAPFSTPYTFSMATFSATTSSISPSDSTLTGGLDPQLTFESIPLWADSLFAVPNGVKDQDPVPFDLQLRPNPASEQLTIGAEGTMEFRSVEVFDLSGARVISLQGNLRAPLSIDLRPLSSGPYILQVEGPGGRVSQSFLKN